jgi:hypothetical protein
MKTDFRSHALLTAVLSLVSVASHSQNLTLFQDSEGNTVRGGFPQGGPPIAAVAEAPGSSTPVLKGIYRFGDTYHVSLQNDQGAVYKASWKEGQNGTAVGGYQIDAVDSRTVTLSLPAGVNCQQSAQSGSNCLGRSQVALSFAESAPVSARQNGPNPRGGGFTFTQTDNGNNRFRGADTEQLRALFEAANTGDPAARDAARTALRDAIGNRGGRGGDNGGGRGGRGGNNNNRGNANANGGGGGGRNGGGFPQ